MELQPRSGPDLGGTVVAVNGAGFENSYLCVCRFGEQIAPSVTFVSSTRLHCTAPPGAGVVRIQVALNGQNFATSLANFDFSYLGNPSRKAVEGQICYLMDLDGCLDALQGWRSFRRSCRALGRLRLGF